MKESTQETKNQNQSVANSNDSPSQINNTASLVAPTYQLKSTEDSVTSESDSSIQLKSTGAESPPNDQTNNNGLPGNLKAGIENLSGMSMDDVNVNYNSSKPAGLNARAYAQGSDIHVGPGQEDTLGHEAWHVVQQKQGRVKPTIQKKGVSINNDNALEKEADVMGAKASNFQGGESSAQLKSINSSNQVSQLDDEFYPDAETEPHIHMHKNGATFTSVGHNHKTIEDNNSVRESAIQEVFQILQFYGTERANSIITWMEQRYDLHPPENEEAISPHMEDMYEAAGEIGFEKSDFLEAFEEGKTDFKENKLSEFANDTLTSPHDKQEVLQAVDKIKIGSVLAGFSWGYVRDRYNSDSWAETIKDVTRDYIYQEITDQFPYQKENPHMSER